MEIQLKEIPIQINTEIPFEFKEINPEHLFEENGLTLNFLSCII